MPNDCPFCEMFEQDPDLPSVHVMEPMHPVVQGHRLVIPRLHVADATTDPETTSYVMARAAVLANDLKPCNIITSVGKEATQTVFHLHVHVVPRRAGDGLTLPWGNADA